MWATNCAVLASPKQGTILRATLTNRSAEVVTHVGVLVGGTEYEFRARIQAHQTTPEIVGIPFGGFMPRDVRGPVSNLDCWARAVDFADGTNWSVSPL